MLPLVEANNADQDKGGRAWNCRSWLQLPW
jgi:hypothetical protein